MSIDNIKGLQLSRLYYEAYGRNMIQSQFSEYQDRIAAGLVGEGSECLGFDDHISMDHDFGPAFCLWLDQEDYLKIGPDLQKAYDALPKSFMGFPVRREGQRSKGRVGALEIRSFYAFFIGDEQPPTSLFRWLYLPEDKLAAVTSGEVFTDPLGLFSDVRSQLKAYYPEDVRIKKIAARAAVMAQSGQYNYLRCMRREDPVAAHMALSHFVQAAISMVYLLNRVYMPYYKWMYRGMRDLQILKNTVPLFRELVELPDQMVQWSKERLGKKGEQFKINDQKLTLIEGISSMILDELRFQGLTYGTEDFLEHHVDRIMNNIKDPILRKCHVLEG